MPDLKQNFKILISFIIVDLARFENRVCNFFKNQGRGPEGFCKRNAVKLDPPKPPYFDGFGLFLSILLKYGYTTEYSKTVFLSKRPVLRPFLPQFYWGGMILFDSNHKIILLETYKKAVF